MVAKDLSEQPKSNFVLIVGATTTNYYAVNSFHQDGDIIRFYDADDVLVYCCRVREGNWALVNRKYIGTVTEADLMRFSRDEHKAESAFLEALDPETFKKAKELIASGMVGVDDEGQMVMMARRQEQPTRTPRTPEEEERLKTGQYL